MYTLPEYLNSKICKLIGAGVCGSDMFYVGQACFDIGGGEPCFLHTPKALDRASAHVLLADCLIGATPWAEHIDELVTARHHLRWPARFSQRPEPGELGHSTRKSLFGGEPYRIIIESYQGNPTLTDYDALVCIVSGVFLEIASKTKQIETGLSIRKRHDDDALAVAARNHSLRRLLDAELSTATLTTLYDRISIGLFDITVSITPTGQTMSFPNYDWGDSNDDHRAWAHRSARAHIANWDLERDKLLEGLYRVLSQNRVCASAA
jgi:hypothetical protein